MIEAWISPYSWYRKAPTSRGATRYPPPRHFLYSDAVFSIFPRSLASLASRILALAWSSSSLMSANSAFCMKTRGFVARNNGFQEPFASFVF